MAATSRWMIRRQERKERTRELEERKRIEGENKIKILPVVAIHLDEQLRVVLNSELKDQTNEFLIVNDFLVNRVYEQDAEFNQKTMDKFVWIDFEDIRLAIIPISDKLRSNAIALKFLVLCQNQELEGRTIKIYADWNREGFYPEEESVSLILHYNKLSTITAYIGNDLETQRGLQRHIQDLEDSKALQKLVEEYNVSHESVTGDKEHSKTFLLLLVGIEKTLKTAAGTTTDQSQVNIKGQRIKIFYEYTKQEIQDYEQLRESNFLNLIESKHVHPSLLKHLIHALIFQYGKFSKRKSNIKIIRNIFNFILMGGVVALSLWFAITSSWGYWILAVVVILIGLGIWTICLANILIAVTEIGNLKHAKRLTLIDKKQRKVEINESFDEKWIEDFCNQSPYWDYNHITSLKDEEKFENIKMV